MIVLEFISLTLIVVLCTLCTISDIKSGLIKNKTLLFFAGIALIVNIIYYGYFAKDLFVEFLINFLVVSLVSLYLFYSSSFAGGDCKLTIVLALLYPARFYVVYGSSNSTLIFAVAFSIFAGYCYLLVNTFTDIFLKKVKITSDYMKKSFFAFLKSYIFAMIYISLLNMGVVLLEKSGVVINVWLLRIFTMVLAFGVNRLPFFRKKLVLISSLSVLVVLSIILKQFPFSISFDNCIFVLVLMLCQTTIRTTIYKNVEINELKKGMILTSMSTFPMQSSITKGLPGISTEDLRSRLTESEIDSIKIWAKATHVDTLTIIKKIPFAIFITIGFISYFILWSLL